MMHQKTNHETDYDLSTLKNGLRVATHTMNYIESIAFSLIVKIGSRYETLEQNGICHFLEHMAFKGTSKRTAKQIAEDFESIGAFFNAYTSREHTVYYAKVLKEHIFKATEIISDIINNSLYLEEEIQKERNVICQEIAASEDSPDEVAFDRLLKNCFESQAIGRSILGTPESISKFSTNDFNSYVSKHYTANNIVVSFAGNIKHEESIKISEKLFSDLRPGEHFSPESALYKSSISVLNKDLEQTNFVLAYSGLGYKEIPSMYHAQLFSLILGGSMSSRLFQKIRENLGLVYTIGAFNNSYSDNGLFCIYGGVSHDKIYKCISAINEELSSIFDDKFSEKEFELAKSQVKSSILMSLEKNTYKSEEIGKNISIFGRSRSTKEILDNLNNITIEDILNIAKRILSTPPSISVVGNSINEKLIEEEVGYQFKQ